MSGTFQQMQHAFNDMPFKPEFTPGGPTQATVRTIVPSTQAKVEEARNTFELKRQKLQIQGIVGKNGEHLG